MYTIRYPPPSPPAENHANPGLKVTDSVFIEVTRGGFWRRYCTSAKVGGGPRAPPPTLCWHSFVDAEKSRQTSANRLRHGLRDTSFLTLLSNIGWTSQNEVLGKATADVFAYIILQVNLRRDLPPSLCQDLRRAFAVTSALTSALPPHPPSDTDQL
ncbi:hypothetical protein R3P38DRAFT_3188771 [Favolaschia claudopus]|uniref:Uncharacterized protein n=1 Tax=Favolaschia claudopus TaxID=2862362 RepID=A0AAW0BUH4_9AGAR